MKHTPATPLPWVYEPNLERGDARTSGYIRERTITAEYAQLGRSVAKAVRFNGSTDQDRNATYIAHACNAYPRLVEALRKVLDPEAAQIKWREARALLRELGEL